MAGDLGGEEARAVLRLHRVAREGGPTADGAIRSIDAGGEVETSMLHRHGLDPGPHPGLGPRERQGLVGSWTTVTDTRLVFHATDTGFWVVRPRPGEMRDVVPRSSVDNIEYADHGGLALVWRCWLVRFDDGTWLLGHSMARGRASSLGMDDESELALDALGLRCPSPPE